MPRLVRNRYWVLAGVLVAAVVLAAVIGGHPKHASANRPRVSFGPQVQQLGATSDLVYTNGWVATSGAQVIGVYAGEERLDRRNGLFVIMRQTGGGSGQKLARVVVHGSGALTMLRPPTPTSEAAAFDVTLHFVSASGATGTLDLSNDRVSLSG